MPDSAREFTGHSRNKFNMRRPIYNNSIKRKALENIRSNWDGSNYNVGTNNCQDFSDALRQEYFRLGGTVTYPFP